MKQQEYQIKAEMMQAKLAKYEEQGKILARFRLLIFVCGVAGLYIGYQYTYVGYLIGVVCLFSFGYLVKKHNALKYQIRYGKAEHQVVQRYIARFSEDWKQIKETGEAFVSEAYPPSSDLDIFGKASLFQYMNVAFTSLGKRQFAQFLTTMPNDRKEVSERQAAVAELIAKHDLVMEIETLGCFANDGIESEQVFRAFEMLHELSYPTFFKVIKWVLPTFTFAMISLALLTGNVYAMLLVEVSVVTQLIISLVYSGKIKHIVAPVFTLKASLTIYVKLFERLEAESFDNAYLHALQQDICGELSATKGISRLASIREMAKMRLNLIAYILLNGLCLWDIHCVGRLEKWYLQYATTLPKWFSMLAELEALMSLTMLANTKQMYCFAEILEGEPSIKMEQGKHPLLLETKAVANDFSIQQAACIITGSNMSGKTTFLRTLGLQTVLALAGAPLNAKTYQTSLMHIFTSMRIEDNVSEGISTFYAELLRIKQMIEFHRMGKPMLALIDEIFKGTNSQDRIFGAKETIRQLASQHSITCVTTHDFELCDLEKDTTIQSVNYHFSEYYKADKLFFDYTIKKGMSTTTNAKYLLRMVGIVSDDGHS